MIRRLVVAVWVLSPCVLACSGGDGTDLAARAPQRTEPFDDSAGQAADDPAATPADDPAGAPADRTSDTTVFVATVPPSVVDVPETGVPGLDSDDPFCAAWSRFGGSFQVIAVNAAFGEGSPESIAALEVLAASTVEHAYAGLGQAWPAELADERSTALDEALGPFARRLEGARAALAAAGATAPDVEEIERAWLDALAARVPDRVDVAVDLPDEIWTIVEDAAARHLQSAGGWYDDTSLVTRVEMPRTDGYLATQCPDQGALAGGDADG